MNNFKVKLELQGFHVLGLAYALCIAKTFLSLNPAHNKHDKFFDTSHDVSDTIK